LSRADAADVLGALRGVDHVLGILPLEARPEQLAGDVEALVCRRNAARAARNFELADAIRDQLVQRGYLVRDLPSGTRVTPQAP